MKKTLSVLILLLMIISTLFITGCRPGGNSDLTHSETAVRILINGYESSYQIESLKQSIYEALGEMPVIINDESPYRENEIIIGKSERPVAKRAFELIERTQRESKYIARYVIYSDGKSIAIAFDSCEGFDDYIIEAVLKRFSKEFVKPGTEITMGGSNLISGSLDILEYQESIDQIKLDSKWASLEKSAEAIVGTDKAKEIVKAFKNMYKMYSDDMLGWLANLYDPEIPCTCLGECSLGGNHGGGFYLSNSARDNEGYLPDIESTAQAMDILILSGMIEDYGNDLQKALPQWLRKQMITFVKGLQNTNGYFYHPQFTKEQTDTHVAKKERDLTKGLDLLSRLGAKPTYTTPNGVTGDGIKADGTPVAYMNLTTPFIESIASAVSRIIAISDSSSSSPHLASKEAFTAYLASLEATLRKDPYTVGNDFASQASTIKSKGYGPILRDWLDDLCYESTGHWYAKNDYMGLNGLMKISAAYNGIGEPLPYPEKMADFAIDMITTTEEEVTVCYAYNTWFTVNNVLNNLARNVSHFGQSEVDRITDHIMDRLYVNAPELIAATHEKQLAFVMNDGSFQYDFGVGGTSLGLPSSVPNTVEGDINATLICMSETIHQITAALGFERVPVYTKADYLRFVEILEGLGKIIKDDEVPIVENATFDMEKIGTTSGEVTIKGTSSSTYHVIADPRKPSTSDAKILEVNAKADGTKTVILDYNQSNNATYTCYVFEGEYCFMEAPVGGFAYLNMGPECYMLTFTGYNSDPNATTADSIGIFEQSNGNGALTREMDLGVKIDIGEWFNIKVEYYVDNTTAPRVKVYVNDTLITVSGNTYDKEGGRLEGQIIKPKTRYEGVEFLVYSYYGAKIYMDNLSCYKLRDIYVPLKEGDVQPTRFNVDAPDKDHFVYDFEKDTSSEAPAGLDSSGVIVQNDTAGKYLSLGTSSKSDITFPLNTLTQNTNCSVFEADITLSSASGGRELTFAFTESATNPNALSKFNIKVENGKAYIYNAPSGSSLSKIVGVEMPVDKSFKFRAEYFDIVKITLFYINGNLVASSDVTTDRAFRYFAELATLSAPSGTNVKVDNVVSERIIKNFNDATHSTVDAKIYDFSEGIGDIVAIGNAYTANKCLNIETLAAAKIPVNQRSVIPSASFFETDIFAKDIAAGSEFTFTLYDANGKIILSYIFKATETHINVYEVTAHTSYTAPLCKFAKATRVKLGISYYAANGVVYISADSNAIAKSHLNYSQSNSLLTANYAIIESKTGSTVKLNTLKLENDNAIYTNIDVAESANPDDGKEILDYEGSSTGNIPSVITPDLGSVGSDISIKELFDINKALSKVLTFTTKSGYNDKLVFGLTGNSAGNCTIVETDFKFEFTGDGSQTSFQFFLETGNNVAYAINMNKSYDLLKFKPLLEVNGENSGDLEYKDVSGAESWHKMKIEYYSGDRNTVRIKLYIDDKLLFDDDSFYEKLYTAEKPVNDITSFRIYTYSTTNAILTLDNTSFRKINKEYIAGDENNPIVQDAAVLPVYGGAQSIIVLVHDDGHIPTASIIDKYLRKYGLSGNVAITAERFLEENLDPVELAYWQAFLDTGRWGMLNHSMTHSFWGTVTDDDITVSNELLLKEVIGSRELLMEMFPTEKFHTFAYPGISSLTSKFGETKVYDEIRKLVASNYLAGRYYGNGAADLYKWDWEWMPTYAVTTNIQSTLGAIDGAVNSGQFMSILMHRAYSDLESVKNDPTYSANDSYWISEDHVKAMCERIAKYVNEGKAWSATYDDAVLYLYEAENAKVITNRTGGLSVKVDDGLDDSVFNFPLSIKVVVDSSFEAVKVTQGDRVTYAKTFVENDLTYAIIDVIPDNTDAVVTEAKLTDIPEAPVAPPTPGTTPEGPTTPSTPPSVSDDDEINMGNGNVKDDGAWTK